MAFVTKRKKEIEKLVDVKKTYEIKDAIELLKKCSLVKFDQSIEMSLKMGVDPKKADQIVRGTVSLPKGTGKKVKVLVFAKGEQEKKAKAAGADFCGNIELLEKVKAGFSDFDVVISTPDMMRDVGKLGKILGPKGLMPSPKAGTVTKDVEKAITEIKSGRIEFKVDKNSVINVIAGKLSFDKEDLLENIKTILKAIVKAKPPGAKGTYLKLGFISSTMGPGLKIKLSSFVG